MKRLIPWLSAGLGLFFIAGLLFLAQTPESQANVRRSSTPIATFNPFLQKYPYHAIIIPDSDASEISIRNPNPRDGQSPYRNVYEIQFFPEAIGVDERNGHSDVYLSVLKIDHEGNITCHSPHPDRSDKCGISYQEKVATFNNLKGFGDQMGLVPSLVHSGLGIGQGVATLVAWYMGINIARHGLLFLSKRLSKFPNVRFTDLLRRRAIDPSANFLATIQNRIQRNALGHSFTLLAVILVPQYIQGQPWADEAYRNLGFRNREQLASILNAILIKSEHVFISKQGYDQARGASLRGALTNAPAYQMLERGDAESGLDAAVAFLEQSEEENEGIQAMIERRIQPLEASLNAALNTDLEAVGPYTVQFISYDFNKTSSNGVPVIDVALRALTRRDNGHGCLNNVQVTDWLSSSQVAGLETLGVSILPPANRTYDVCIGTGRTIHQVGFFQGFTPLLNNPLQGLPVHHQ